MARDQNKLVGVCMQPHWVVLVLIIVAYKLYVDKFIQSYKYFIFLIHVLFSVVHVDVLSRSKLVILEITLVNIDFLGLLQ